MKMDLQKLISAVAVVAGNSPIVLICAPGQAVAVNLRAFDFGYPVLVSSALADGTVIAIATAALVSATGGSPSIDTTKTASYSMDDAAPGAIMTGGQRVIASFQNDTIGIRLRLPISWALRVRARNCSNERSCVVTSKFTEAEKHKFSPRRERPSRGCSKKR